jgi:hypothetical protein
MKTYKSLAFLFFFLLFCGSFSWAQVKPYDILINEFMPAPAANRLLPNVEYIELYNRSQNDIELNNFMIINKPDTTILRQKTLKSNAYVIIYTKNASVNFREIDNTIDTIQVKKLGTLSNPSDMIYLLSPSNIVIDAAGYDLTYYQNVNKAETGLALERTRPNAPCNSTNWTPSVNSRGGTPGKRNSVVNDSTDLTTPLIDQYYLKTDKRISLTFNRSVNQNLLKMPSQYQIFAVNNIDTTSLLTPRITTDAPVPSNNIITVKSVDTIISPLFNTVELTLDSALRKGSLYKLVIKPILKDCQDLPIPLSIYSTLYLQMFDKPIGNDLIINEILVNPETGGSRFIEIYNRSKKAIDIKNLQIKDTTRNDVKSILLNFLLLPKQYVVLTEKPSYVRSRYNVPDSAKFNILKSKVPTWNEASGNVSISLDTVTFDNLNYAKSLHNPLLATTDGVSLERTNPFAVSAEPSNWQSAAEKRSFATPAQKNSQYRDLQAPPSVSAAFWLEKDSFSPDDDGFEDALLIRYQLDKKGGVANVQVFDSNGRFVKSLTINELLGTEGVLRWQGERADGTKAVVGIYILVLDLTFSDGTTARQKLPCALTTQF